MQQEAEGTEESLIGGAARNPRQGATATSTSTQLPRVRSAFAEIRSEKWMMMSIEKSAERKVASLPESRFSLTAISRAV